VPDKSWKAAERAVARLLGGERIAVSGRARSYATDASHPRLSLEVKHRQTGPAWIEDALARAESSSTDGKLAVAVLHGNGARYGKSLCVLRLEDLAELLQGGEGIDSSQP
jgi:hypothetical protein